MHLILARHGQSFANVDSKRFLDTDSPLTPLGVQQSERLGMWLRMHQSDIDRVICSPLKRAKRTAEIVNQYLHLPLQVDDRLAEIERFDLPYLDLRDHPLKPETTQDVPDDGYMETYKARVQLALEDLLANLHHPYPTLIVAHGGTNATLFRLIMERNDLFVRSNNTSFMSLRWTEGRWHLLAMNATPHLPPEMIS